jgi:hypothetical protein
VNSGVMTCTHNTCVERVNDFTRNVLRGKFISSLEKGFGTRFTN